MGDQFAKEVASPPRRAKQTRNGKKCSLFIGYHAEAELVAEDLNFLKKSKCFEFSYKFLKYQVSQKKVYGFRRP